MGSADRSKRSPFLVAHCAHFHSFAELELPPSLQLSENSCLCQGHLRVSMGYSVSPLSLPPSRVSVRRMKIPLALYPETVGTAKEGRGRA